MNIRQIVLYHAFNTIVPGTDMPILVTPDDKQIYLESIEELSLLRDRLKPMVGTSVKIDVLAENISLPELPERINFLCKERSVDFIVMGVSGKSKFEKIMIGSTTSEMLKSSEFPVLVVPNEALIEREIKTIVFTTDLEDVSGIPAHQINSFLDMFNANIDVVNVKPDTAERYKPEMETSIIGLHHLLDKYHASFHYIKEDDVVEGILEFAEQHKASLIITVPKKHNFFPGLFHKSVSKKLVYNSKVPMLSLPSLK